MCVRFENNFYFRIVKDNPDFFDDEDIFSEHVQKSDLLFKYGNVNRQKFNEEYLEEGWLGRKIIALPAALWAGLIKTIYHLAKALFVGIPTAWTDRGQSLKVLIYTIARDFQEAYGRMTSIFSDQYGQFHVQESQFQTTCYNNHITRAFKDRGYLANPPTPSGIKTRFRVSNDHIDNDLQVTCVVPRGEFFAVEIPEWDMTCGYHPFKVSSMPDSVVLKGNYVGPHSVALNWGDILCGGGNWRVLIFKTTEEGEFDIELVQNHFGADSAARKASLRIQAE